ncbi:hypothetical protein [Amycolatopsis jiangsuensis]|uniref:Uncharacterized protein n=1 Tax=Amycolatopsis jiangsuensis TaxID=1181879 RepID=A0A840IUS4_9PSEU|nr:hypothetical protein [Amycolatopsis jiangsuensis]MBB4685533.1 hypothetical protein [Amycolatopsis jiangsuensis]
MDNSTSPATPADAPKIPNETADLAFVLRAMQADLGLFERLQPEKLMDVIKAANIEIARMQALQLHCLAGLRRRRSDA